MDNSNFQQAANMSDAELEATLKNMSNEEVLEVVARALLAEKGITDLDEDTEKDMVKDLVERETEFINRAVFEKLSAEQLDELDKIIDEGGDAEAKVQQFIANAGVDVEATTTEALGKFREVYLNANETAEE